MRRTFPIRDGRIPSGLSSISLQVGLAAIASFQIAISYGQATIGKIQLIDDVTGVWRPLMNVILEGGVPLYTQNAVDNKPPLFQYLNLLAGVSGEYVLTFYAIIGLCNAVAVVLLYRWVRDGIGEAFPAGTGAGLLAAILFLGSLPLTGGTNITPRGPMLVGILAAVQLESGWRRGAALAAAALFSQYAILGAPVLAYDGVRKRSGKERWEWLASYSIGGVGMVLIAFIPLLVLWGWPSVVGGITDGLFSQYRPVTEQTAANMLADPYSWLRGFVSTANTIWFLIVPAGIGLVCYGLKTWTRRASWYSLPVALLVVYLFPLALKSLGYYFLHMLPFAAAIGSCGIVSVITWDDTQF